MTEARGEKTLIKKAADGGSNHPVMPDYDRACAEFSWQTERESLGAPRGGGLNIARETVDRHAATGLADSIALRCVDQFGAVHDITYLDLSLRSNRFANLLRGLGTDKGDSVFTLLGRVPEQHIVALGAFKNGSVFSALFAAFGPEPIETRMALGRARILVTDAQLYRRKIAPIRDRLPDLRHVLISGDKAEAEVPPGTINFAREMTGADDGPPAIDTDAEDPAILHFTSGTTGTPKGAVHVHEAVVAHHMTARLALDLRPGDRFWCTADPGWVTGVSYGIVAPLAVGATAILDEEEFDAHRWYAILRDHRVDVWYTAPTAIRMLMRTGSGPETGGDAHNAAEDGHGPRFMASVGEPLNRQGVLWGLERFGEPFHDTWWQTETGAIMIGNYRCADVKPGAMGRPLPGIEAAIVHRRGDHGIDLVTQANEEGELALRAGWPSMFRGYLDQPERTQACFRDGWYLSGDLVRRDADGVYWFVGRVDDVIKSSGHLIGPLEVESALMDHPAVAEVGVIGRPDPIVGEVVKAFVSLKPGHVGDDALARVLVGQARRRLGASVAPREIAFVDNLPKTRSGKIMRRLLRARETGAAEGDTSTLDTALDGHQESDRKERGSNADRSDAGRPDPD